jgi:hypothetical protein
MQNVTTFDRRPAGLDILQRLFAVVRNCHDAPRRCELPPQECLVYLMVFREEDVQRL